MASTCASMMAAPVVSSRAATRGTRVSMRATVVQGRRAAGMQVVAKVRDSAMPSSYEAIFLMKPGVEDSVRSAEVDQLKAIFMDGGATEFEVTDRGLVQNAYEIKGFPDSHQYMMHMTCPPATAKKVQDFLATPVIGKEPIVLRYMFFKQ
mmetsp:Transcript_4424/g.10788  ORF Transcript_4424/g.10788 Transcript_4424/m.10788 type:complete len:150 (+) Transcript_4424:95-544(+)|eukprot:CAMPEP_0197580004 /NCGR_PEP_ID=MMETSP1326-20131121/3896_1 /TAXON_ID=1155430 /ORGANISM="Genus nov. species nov., Strain RCC2288" /LENGTH=149 /DNA_ID=CAMNT_0043143639 /DNA_START=89 /DNA_END=538 /DNA_ORIENTATION=+